MLGSSTIFEKLSDSLNFLRAFTCLYGMRFIFPCCLCISSSHCLTILLASSHFEAFSAFSLIVLSSKSLLVSSIDWISSDFTFCSVFLECFLCFSLSKFHTYNQNKTQNYNFLRLYKYSSYKILKTEGATDDRPKKKYLTNWYIFSGANFSNNFCHIFSCVWKFTVNIIWNF